MKKLINTIKNKITAYLLIFIIIAIWYIVTALNIVPSFILPSPIDVIKAFFSDFYLIISHLWVTIIEAFLGLVISIVISFFIAILMDRFKFFEKTVYPLIVLTQSVPTIAIAPLIILIFGFGLMPKIFLIFLTCFFPLTISILTGFKNIDKDIIIFMKSLDASYFKILFLLKIPYSLKSFFSGLKIAASYCISAAVVSEWLGGEKGLGVYMIRVKNAYAFDKMFASIILISLLSILFVQFIKFLENKAVYWKN